MIENDPALFGEKYTGYVKVNLEEKIKILEKNGISRKQIEKLAEENNYQIDLTKSSKKSSLVSDVILSGFFAGASYFLFENALDFNEATDYFIQFGISIGVGITSFLSFRNLDSKNESLFYSQVLKKKYKEYKI